MKKDSLVRNAADKKQVKEAGRKERDVREDELNDLRALLDMPEGRRFLWRLLERCKTFASIWEPSAKIHYNAGIQDTGHYLLAEIMEAHEDSLLRMMKEAKDGKN